MVAQFMSNHFRAGQYFERFKIDNPNKLCIHQYEHARERDHLMFECDRFSTQRNELCEQLNLEVNELCWEIILEQPALLIPFLANTLENWCPLDTLDSELGTTDLDIISGISGAESGTSDLESELESELESDLESDLEVNAWNPWNIWRINPGIRSGTQS